MSDHTIKIFKSGVHNSLSDEIIPVDAAQDAKNWVSSMGIIELVRGRLLLGAEGAAGMIRGLHWGYKIDGTKILFKKNSTKIQYWDGNAWQDTITGLTAGAEYTFANVSSLSGAFVWVSGVDGLYKINTANPGSYLSLYDATKNDKGKIMIDKGRLIMWDCVNASKTTIKLSHIDGQDNYTTVASEVISGSGATYAGILGAKTESRNIFAVVIKGTTGGTLETFTDNKDGTLTSDKGGTGTINYTTGAYSITFSATATSVTADYQWEDSQDEGLADFTFSATRVASEGNRITQDIGGDALSKIEVGQDGAYYSLKEQSSYRLAISADDTTFENLVYRREIGIPNFRASVSTSKGIVFMNTANPDNPELTILKRNPLGDSIEPYTLFPHFDFSLYDYSDCAIDTYDNYVIIACKEEGFDFNNIILLCDIVGETVDITHYPARVFAKDNGVLYVGSPITESVYKIFNGFDDEGDAIDNFWTGRGETYKSEFLKKFKRYRLQGLISKDQELEVYISYDGEGFTLLGTISGSGDSVDSSETETIGANMIGEEQIGGPDGESISGSPYYAEFKVPQTKFRKRTIKFVATGIGYVSVNNTSDFNIIPFENKIPSRFRVKKT